METKIHDRGNNLLLTIDAPDLRGANLRGANLRGANLRDANLLGANLRDADLRDANLWDANLRDANLWEADLRDADLRGANLVGAALCYADLRGADLRGADLCCSDLRGAHLQGAVLETGESFTDYITTTIPALLTAGGRTLQEVSAAWEYHSWEDCPIAVAFSCQNFSEVPERFKLQARQFIRLFDAGLLPVPQS